MLAHTNTNTHKRLVVVARARETIGLSVAVGKHPTQRQPPPFSAWRTTTKLSINIIVIFAPRPSINIITHAIHARRTRGSTIESVPSCNAPNRSICTIYITRMYKLLCRMCVVVFAYDTPVWFTGRQAASQAWPTTVVNLNYYVHLYCHIARRARAKPNGHTRRTRERASQILYYIYVAVNLVWIGNCMVKHPSTIQNHISKAQIPVSFHLTVHIYSEDRRSVRVCWMFVARQFNAFAFSWECRAEYVGVGKGG